MTNCARAAVYGWYGHLLAGMYGMIRYVPLGDPANASQNNEVF